MDRKRINAIRGDAEFCLEIDGITAVELTDELTKAQDIMDEIVDEHKAIRSDTVQIPMEVYEKVLYFVRPELREVHAEISKRLDELERLKEEHKKEQTDSDHTTPRKGELTMKRTDGMPVLQAYETTGGLRAWCPFCVTYHTHGAGDGHRMAHCAKSTPFTQTGYELQIVKQLPL